MKVENLVCAECDSPERKKVLRRRGWVDEVCANCGYHLMHEAGGGIAVYERVSRRVQLVAEKAESEPRDWYDAKVWEEAERLARLLIPERAVEEICALGIGEADARVLVETREALA